jgi:hypothetical protein
MVYDVPHEGAVAMYHWEVEVPKEGDLTRTQGWAAISKLVSNLGDLLSRLKANSYPDDDTSPLSGDEREEMRAAHKRLRDTNERLKGDVLDQLAELSDKSDEDENDLFPKDVNKVLSDYHGDVCRFTRKNRDNGKDRILALALLQQTCDLEDYTISAIIQKHMAPDTRYSDVYGCPRCDAEGSITREHPQSYSVADTCKRCFGWGYVFSKPEDSEYDWSQKGRREVNDGREWTPEMEAEEQAIIAAEYDD